MNQPDEIVKKELVELAELRAERDRLAKKSASENTKRAYRSDFDQFTK
jgi:hypothetical protein